MPLQRVSLQRSRRSCWLKLHCNHDLLLAKPSLTISLITTTILGVIPISTTSARSNMN